MTNKFIFKILSLVLVVVMLSGVLFACFDDSGFAGLISSTTQKGSPTSTTKLSGGNPDEWAEYPSEHKDIDNDGYCDDCQIDVVETIDFYNFNDLHGKFEDSDENPGVDELTSYLENRREIDEYLVLLSSGDMWQGGSASNGTHGRIITDWMNYLEFDAMTLGNHEFDWGQDAIKANVEMAEFPILAINIYDNITGERVNYCEPSVMIERGGAKIGIIGAIGDCYSSISSTMTQGIHFKVGKDLTNLVKAESEKLRDEGADIVLYLIHDGTDYREKDVSVYYDETLSRDGYIDLVFGGHTHSYYTLYDNFGVPHLQGGGDNTEGISHVELEINFANGEIKFNRVGYVKHYQAANMEDSPIVNDLINKYWDEIGWMYETLGYNAQTRDSYDIQKLVTRLYFDKGVETWGDKYDIVLAGGSINVRSPYEVPAGDVMYGDLQMVLPFDNPLYLCSIKGSDLKSKFIDNSKYSKYYTISYSSIKDNETYYIIADSWTALYELAQCKVIEQYDATTYARDLLAEYIKNGGWSK